MDSTLQGLGLPRKTIGINVTQIGLDDVRAPPTSLMLVLCCAVTNWVGRIRVPADSGRPSAVSPRRLHLVFACLAVRVACSWLHTLQFWRPNRLCQRF